MAIRKVYRDGRKRADTMKTAMAAKRTTISLPPGLYEKAKEVMKAKHYPDFSGFIAQLIREAAEQHARENNSPRKP